MTVATNVPTFTRLPIEQVKESPLNPRKHYDQKAVDDITASIREKGIINPLLVRPINGQRGKEGVCYELISGSRRLRAAKAVGLKDLPVLVYKDLSDHVALELMIIDNLQREDVHPLDEAVGYQQLIKQYADELRKTDPKAKLDTAKTMASIAAKIGKSTSYIYQRLKLASLIEPAQKALFDDRITPGHAILIARLQDPDQKRALEVCTRIISMPRDAKQFGEEAQAPDEGTISVKALQQWIDEYIHVKVDSIAFDKSDPKLNPEAGPCTTCKKLTGNDPTLHPEIKNPRICTDHTCFRKKVEAHFELQHKRFASRLYPITDSQRHYSHGDHEAPLLPTDLTPREFDQGLKYPGKWKERKLKSGENDKTKGIKWGIFVTGQHKGETIPIKLIEPKPKPSLSSSERAGVRSPQPPSEAQIKKQREKEGKEAFESSVDEKLSMDVFTKVIEKCRHPLPDFILQRVADDLSDNIMSNTDKDPEEFTRLILKSKNKLTRDEACKVIAGSIITDSIEYEGLNQGMLFKLAKHYSINIKAIEKQVRLELTPRPPKLTKSAGGPKSRKSGSKRK